MKKIIGMSMLLLVSLVLVGCGNKNTTTTTETTTVETDEWTTTETTTTEVTTENNIEQDAPDVEATNEEVIADIKGSVGAASCDRYIEFMQCVYGKMEFWSEQFLNELMKLKQTRAKETDKSALEDNCSMMVKVIVTEQWGVQDGCEI